MAAVAGAMIAGAGATMSAYSAAAQGNAEQIAADYNAMVNERNAKRAEEKAREDERRFRIAVRKQEGQNIVAVGASGVTGGSALEALRINARKAGEDAIAIRMGGSIARDQFLLDAKFSRESGQSAARGASLGAASQILSFAGSQTQRSA